MPIETGVHAPDFDLVDCASEESRKLSNALEKGPVVLTVYKSSCRASKVAFPLLENLYRSYPDDRLSVWGIALDSANITTSFARRYEITFPLLIDPEGYPTAQEYDVSETPTVFLLDQDGNIAWQLAGFDKSAMQELSESVATMLGVPAEDITAQTEDIPERVPG